MAIRYRFENLQTGIVRYSSNEDASKFSARRNEFGESAPSNFRKLIIKIYIDLFQREILSFLIRFWET